MEKSERSFARRGKRPPFGTPCARRFVRCRPGPGSSFGPRAPRARERRNRVLEGVPGGGQRREGTGDVPETPRGGAPPPPHDRGGDRGAQEAGVLELSTPFHKYGCIRAPLHPLQLCCA